MEPSVWLLFAATILIASVSPGPNVLIVVVNALTHGRAGAAWTIFGNLVCLFCVALIASIGVGAAIATAPLAFQVMKICGGAYLAWLGFKMIRASFRSAGDLKLSADEGAKRRFSGRALFCEAFLVSASNPKSILFLTAVFPQFLDTQRAMAPQFAVMFATIVGLVMLIHGGYAYLAMTVRNRTISSGFRQWLQRITGGMFVGLGAGVAFSK